MLILVQPGGRLVLDTQHVDGYDTALRLKRMGRALAQALGVSPLPAECKGGIGGSVSKYLSPDGAWSSRGAKYAAARRLEPFVVSVVELLIWQCEGSGARGIGGWCHRGPLTKHSAQHKVVEF